MGLRSCHVFVLLSAGVLVLAACSGGDSTLSRAPATPAPLATSFTITPATGGALSAEAGGPQVVIAAGVVANSQSVSATFTTAKGPAPNPAWATVNGTLAVDFSKPLPILALSATTSQTDSAVTLRMPYPADRAAAVLAARAPVVSIVYANHTSTVLSPDGSFDTQLSQVSVTLPKAALSDAVGVRLSLAVDSAAYPTPVPTGPLYYVAAPVPMWTAAPQPLADVPTLVLLHGLFSNIQIAFPPACVARMLKAYGYAQAVGLNYDYAQPVIASAPTSGVTPIGPILSAFVNSLPTSAGTPVLIESHSYGTLVATGALSLGSITKSIRNVVLLGGPLPDNGSPQADPGFFRYLILHAAEIEVPPSKVQEAKTSGMLAGLQPNSGELEAIASALRSAPAAPNYIQIAGTHYLPDEFYIYPLYYIEFGGPFNFEPNDGVVERISALSRDFLSSNPSVSQTSFDIDHLQLKCANPDLTTPYIASHLVQ